MQPYERHFRNLKDLADWLEETFPLGPVSPGDSMPDIMFRAGQQNLAHRLVRTLRASDPDGLGGEMDGPNSISVET